MPMSIPPMPNLSMPTISMPGQQPRANGPQTMSRPKDVEGGTILHDLTKPNQADHHQGATNFSVTCLLFTGIALVAGVFVAIACLVNAVHRVEEGSVAVYYKHGALMDLVAGPGLHFSTPFVTQHQSIGINPETRYINPLKCTTSDGVVNVFREIQVISSLDPDKILFMVRKFGTSLKKILVYDRIEEGVQTFCANHSIDEVYNTKFLEIGEFVSTSLNESISKFAEDAITIWKVFIPKPEIPPAIAANYRQVKVEWTLQLVAQQKQKTERIKKQTEFERALADAKRLKQVDEVKITEEIQRKEGEKNISSIANAMVKLKEENLADIESYKKASEAAANQNLLTDQYIKLQMSKALVNNNKIYFSGQDSALGSILNQIIKPGA